MAARFSENLGLWTPGSEGGGWEPGLLDPEELDTPLAPPDPCINGGDDQASGTPPQVKLPPSACCTFSTYQRTTRLGSLLFTNPF